MLASFEHFVRAVLILIGLIFVSIDGLGLLVQLGSRVVVRDT